MDHKSAILPTSADTLPVVSTAGERSPWAAGVDSLPPLPEGCARLVHGSRPTIMGKIMRTGLHYCGDVMLTTTVHSSNDTIRDRTGLQPGYSGPGFHYAIFDVPYDQLRTMRNSSGAVHPRYAVGVLEDSSGNFIPASAFGPCDEANVRPMDLPATICDRRRPGAGGSQASADVW